MKLYLADISAAVEKVEKDRAAIGLEDISCLKGSDLLSASRDKNIEGKVVAIGEKWLCDGFKDVSHQLYFITGGNGSYANSRGNGCFCVNLYTGEDTRIERYEVLGEVPEDKILDFAKEHLAKARADYDVNSMFLIHSPFDGLDFLTYPVISLIAVPIYFGVFVICDLCAHKKGERFYNKILAKK